MTADLFISSTNQAAVFLNRVRIFLFVPVLSLVFLLGHTAAVFAAGQLQWQVNQTGAAGPNFSGPVLIQADGKIVVGGARRAFPFGSGSDFALTRLLPSGALDLSFGANGAVVTPFVNFSCTVNALALQPDGKIIAAGLCQGFTTSAAFARYNPDGSLDASFNGGGKFLIGTSSLITAVTVLPDGKILAAGSSSVTTVSDFMLIRLGANGAFDNTFGSGGTLVTPVTNQSDSILSMAVQPDGKIVVAGYADFGSQEGNTFVVVRYLPDGNSDPTFDEDSFTATDFGDPHEYASAVALQANGKIVAAGFTDGPGSRGALVRFNADGSYDGSFGTGGKVVIPAETLTTSRITELAIQSNGKIVTAGAATSGTTTGLLVSRFRRDGSLDTSFDGDGILLIPTSPGWRNLTGAGLAIRTNSSILVTANESTDKTGIRGITYSIVGDPQTTADFDADGITDLSQKVGTGDWIFRFSTTGFIDTVSMHSVANRRIVPADYDGDGRTDAAEWSTASGSWIITESSTGLGRQPIFGANGDIPAPADFDGDGKADLAVFRPSNGYWYINNSSDGSFSFIPWGSSGDIPVAGDYDADGWSDQAIFRRNAATGFGEWWIQYSGGGNFVTVFGTNTDVPVAADYTGDGKTDVAVWRPSDGFWFILRSEDFNYYAAPFGQAGDYLVPGDYDGDGRSDIAVFRGSTRFWYINQSSGGIIFRQFGGLGDRPIPSAYIP